MLLAAAAPGGAQEPRAHLEERELAALDAAVGRASAWLVAGQREDGAFAPRVRDAACPVALTGLALWAMCGAEEASFDAAAAERAAAFLVAHLQPGGGIYDPRRSLSIYTSGIAGRALASFHGRSGWEPAAAAAHTADLFAYRLGPPESLVDEEQASGATRDQSAERARGLLADGEHGARERSALEFLSGLESGAFPRRPARLRVPGAETLGLPERLEYDDVLQLVYRDLRPEHQLAMRARDAIRAAYTLERNPDLSLRYGGEGFRPGTQGLYYYYLSVARSLGVFLRPEIEGADGQTHDWVRDLSRRLIRLQRPDGSWSNEDGRWWEDEPVLVTSYALLALAECRRMPRLEAREPTAAEEDR